MGLNEANANALEARGIDVELAAKLGVGNSSKAGFDIEIPYRVGGVVVNRKYRTLGQQKRFTQDKDARKVLWNFDCLSDSTLEGPLLITEGEFDALIAMQCGYGRVVSVPDGGPAQEQGEQQGAKYSYITESMVALNPVREIILCTDGDQVGHNLMNDLALRLGRARCKWVTYPKGCKDLNDAFRLYGEKGVRKTVERAKWMAVDGIYRMSELPPLPYAKPHSVGIIGLEDHFNIRLGDFTVCTGVPGHGKTAFLNNVSGNMVNLHGWKIAMASFEQKPQLDHRRELRTFHGEKLEIHLSPKETADADTWIDENFVFIVPGEDDEVTLDWTLKRCSTAVVRHGCKLVIIDPWNEMDHDTRDMSLTKYTGFAIKQFKRFAAKHRVHVIIAAHPAKMQRVRGSNDIPIPGLYDISDSAHWYNKPDAGIVIHRQGEDTLIRVVKTRYHTEIGKPGDVLAGFDRTRNRFSMITRPIDECVR
jgi:twinkle protein